MPEAVRVDELPTTILIVSCPRPLAPLSHVMRVIDIGWYIESTLASGRLRVFFVARRAGSLAPCGALLMTARGLLLVPRRRIFTALHRDLVLVELLRRRDNLRWFRCNRDLLRTGRTCGDWHRLWIGRARGDRHWVRTGSSCGDPFNMNRLPMSDGRVSEVQLGDELYLADKILRRTNPSVGEIRRGHLPGIRANRTTTR
jgi:hypothetical protein